MYGEQSKEPTSTMDNSQAPPPNTLDTQPTTGMADQLQKDPASREPLKGKSTLSRKIAYRPPGTCKVHVLA